MRSPSLNEATALWMVMPRWRSRARVSVCVVPPIDAAKGGDDARLEEDAFGEVVLPASTCAKIPRLSVAKSRILHVDRSGRHEKAAHR